MTTKLQPFPPLVDLQSASWPLYGPEANAEIASRNNQLIARLALQKIEFGDHIYGFPFISELNGEKIK